MTNKITIRIIASPARPPTTPPTTIGVDGGLPVLDPVPGPAVDEGDAPVPTPVPVGTPKPPPPTAVPPAASSQLVGKVDKEVCEGVKVMNDEGVEVVRGKVEREPLRRVIDLIDVVETDGVRLMEDAVARRESELISAERNSLVPEDDMPVEGT